MSRHWAVILAGGDGVRLRSMTRTIAGDDRPKQFCALVSEEPLLTETRRRAALAVPAHRTLVVVNRAHERFYTPLLADVRTRLVVAQPENRGTAPAILYALLVLAARQAASDTVALYPSDHFVSDDADFTGQIEEAFAGAARRPDLVTLLGIAPDGAEPGYGWIEPGEPVAGAPSLRQVRRFWEKPSVEDAERLRAQGWLWNSFVMVGRVSTMLALVRMTAPDLHRSFSEIAATLGTVGGVPALERLYCGLPSVDFSRQVLSARPDALAVLPVRGVHWSDLGDPERVLTTRRRARTMPMRELIPVSISA
ncbi:MAG TPA: sugar phosphate nucleotidyltransferase [Methylomirabilota bacterium]|nr:sugar phosphate nucleotidyltransferase [Methylomirabilota bacterium]